MRIESCEAKVKELTIELHKHRERQKVLDARRTVEQCLDEESLRQDEIRQAEEKLSAVEEVLRAAVKSEQEPKNKCKVALLGRCRTARARWKPSLEAWTRTSGGPSTRTQATGDDELKTSETHCGSQAKTCQKRQKTHQKVILFKVGTSLFESRYVERGHEDAHQGPGPELRIKNTFYEFCIPKDAEPLVRLSVACFEEPFHDDMLPLHTV